MCLHSSSLTCCSTWTTFMELGEKTYFSQFIPRAYKLLPRHIFLFFFSIRHSVTSPLCVCCLPDRLRLCFVYVNTNFSRLVGLTCREPTYRNILTGVYTRACRNPFGCVFAQWQKSSDPTCRARFPKRHQLVGRHSRHFTGIVHTLTQHVGQLVVV
jgi:hypothetical protein